MYGTGSGLKPKALQNGRAARPGMFGTGQGATKRASASPSDGDIDLNGAGLPTGFHRPASEQPDQLESGGTRFQSSEARYGTGHGVVEAGRLRMGKGRSHAMGKHAHMLMFKEADTFDDFVESTKKGLKGSGEYISDVGGTAARSAAKGVKAVGRTADKYLREGAKSPAASTAAAALLAYGGLRGLRGLGRGAVRLARGAGKKPPPGIIERASKGLKNIISGD